MAGILLAAGKSSRMGRLKQTLPFKGQTLLGHSLTQALHSRLGEVVLVLGHRCEEIRKSIPLEVFPDKLRIVENRDYAKGLSTSLIAGLDAVEGRYRHVMFLLADMPGVKTELIDLLVVRYLESGLPAGAVMADCRAVHPVIFGACLYPEIKRLTGDVGAKSILEANSGRICMVEPPGNYDFRDTDTPEDYREILTL